MADVPCGAFSFIAGIELHIPAIGKRDLLPGFADQHQVGELQRIENRHLPELFPVVRNAYTQLLRVKNPGSQILQELSSYIVYSSGASQVDHCFKVILFKPLPQHVIVG